MHLVSSILFILRSLKKGRTFFEDGEQVVELLTFDGEEVLDVEAAEWT